jgi:spermidine synthase
MVKRKKVYEREIPDKKTAVSVEDNEKFRIMRIGGSGIESIYRKDGRVLDRSYWSLILLPYFLVPGKTGNVLFLGLGGGTSVRIYLALTDMKIGVVDISREIAETARDYFGIKESGRLKIHVMDAREYIENSRKKYDVIVLDVFELGERKGEIIPKHIKAPEFFKVMRKRLKKEGVLVMNAGKKHKKEDYERMRESALYAFPGSSYYVDRPDKKNSPQVLMCTKRDFGSVLDLRGVMKKGMKEKGNREALAILGSYVDCVKPLYWEEEEGMAVLAHM